MDGLPNGTVEAAFRDRHDNLWFGTTNGLTRFVPGPERVRKPPNILLMGVRINGESENVPILGESAIPQIELGADQKQVSVDFLGLGKSLGEKLQYEYRFGETAWSPTSISAKSIHKVLTVS